MINFFKKLFGAKPAETPVPYKVEAPVAPTLTPVVEATPVPVEAPAKAPKAKKPTVKKATTRKPKAPKA
jgi:hypothetical protein